MVLRHQHPRVLSNPGPKRWPMRRLSSHTQLGLQKRQQGQVSSCIPPIRTGRSIAAPTRMVNDLYRTILPLAVFFVLARHLRVGRRMHACFLSFQTGTGLAFEIVADIVIANCVEVHQLLDQRA